jgi:PadR family transcriptional regulator PadR
MDVCRVVAAPRHPADFVLGFRANPGRPPLVKATVGKTSVTEDNVRLKPDTTHSPAEAGHHAMSKPPDLVQGTLDLLLLKILALEPLHGWAISQRLKQVSGDELQVSDGSLYPALHKLELAGWITAEWKTSELGRRAKFYSLTRAGRRYLEQETAHWHRLTSAISRVLALRET